MNTPASHEPHNGQSGVNGRTVHLPDGRVVLPESSRSRPEHGNAHEASKFPVTPQYQRETQFEVCADGTLLELVREKSGDLSFAAYRNGTSTFCRTFQQEQVTLVPPRIHHTTAEALYLPRSIGPSETAGALLQEIEDLLATFLDIDEVPRKLTACFALSTWLSDLSPVAPYLWIVGPYTSGKSSALQLLGTVCRRGVIAGDISPAALYQLVEKLHPTLLLDEFEMFGDAHSRSLRQLLRNGSSQGQRVLRGTRAYDVFGPKAIASRQGPLDTALASRAIFVSMRPTNRELATLTPEGLEAIADQMQPKLLNFRLENYRRVKVMAGKRELNLRMQDIARALVLPFCGDVNFENEIVDLLKPQNAQATFDRYREPEWIVTIALYSRIHRATNTLTVQELTWEVDKVLADAGETYRLAPRKVGEILRCLGFPTERLGSQGRGLRLSRCLLREIHLNAKRMGVCRADILLPEVSDGGYGGPPCAICEELGLMVDFHGKKLTCIDLYSWLRKRKSRLYEQCQNRADSR